MTTGGEQAASYSAQTKSKLRNDQLPGQRLFLSWRSTATGKGFQKVLFGTSRPRRRRKYANALRHHEAAAAGCSESLINIFKRWYVTYMYIISAGIRGFCEKSFATAARAA